VQTDGTWAWMEGVRDAVFVRLGAGENLGEFLAAPLLDFSGQAFGAFFAAGGACFWMFARWGRMRIAI